MTDITLINSFEYIPHPRHAEDNGWGLHPFGWIIDNGNATSSSPQSTTWACWIPSEAMAGFSHPGPGVDGKRYELIITHATISSDTYHTRWKHNYIWHAKLIHYTRRQETNHLGKTITQTIGDTIWSHQDNNKQTFEKGLQDFFDTFESSMEILDIYTALQSTPGIEH